MGELVSQAEAARRYSVTRQSVNDLVLRGVLPLTNGKVDLEIAHDVLHRRLDPARSKILQQQSDTPTAPALPPPDRPPAASDAMADPSITSFQVARTLREKYAALEGRLRYEQACGRLVDAERVGRLLTTAAASVRLALEVLPDKLAPRLAAESDPTACHALLDQAIEEALATLLDLDLAAQALDEDAA